MCNVCVDGQGFRGVVVLCVVIVAGAQLLSSIHGQQESRLDQEFETDSWSIDGASLRKIAKLDTQETDGHAGPHARRLRVYSVVHVPLGLWPVDGWDGMGEGAVWSEKFRARVAKETRMPSNGCDAMADRLSSRPSLCSCAGLRCRTFSSSNPNPQSGSCRTEELQPRRAARCYFV